MAARGKGAQGKGVQEKGAQGKASRREAVAERTAAGKAEPPLRPAQCRAYMRKALAREFRGIVDGFVESAKQGSCQHVKLATELMKGAERTPLRGRGKVEAFLRKLEKEAGCANADSLRE